MKKMIATAVSSAMVLSGAAVTMVSALDVNGEVDISVSQGRSGERGGEKPEAASMGMEMKASSTGKVEMEDSDDDGDDDRDSARGNATSSAARERHDDDNDNIGDDRRNGSDEDDEDGEDGEDELTPKEHRSKVAEFVKHLLEIADHDRGGIGQEVRVVAKEQDDSASTTAEAMTHVESRNPILVFLIGSDYKNLGKIRSEIKTTDNSISRLKNVLDKTTDTSVKADLQAQIDTLETSKVDLEAYVDTHESSFSLFGWAVRLFGGSSSEE